MKILIAGCGDVGEMLAQQLSEEGYDLTIIDSDPRVLETGIERYDIMAVQGNCASMEALRRAGVKKSHLLIACTGSDELNLLCCMTAHSLNPRLHTIARIRDPEYLEQVYQMRDAFGISMTFNPDQDAAEEIERLLKYPGFLTRERFMGGRAELAELRLDAENPLCGVKLRAMESIVKCRVLVCAVLRDGEAMIPDGEFVLAENDRIFITASSDNLATMLKHIGIVSHRARHVMIAGGGTMSYYLAKALRTSRSVDVQIVEPNAERCTELSVLLPHATVLQGDLRNQKMLVSEGLLNADALVSLTDSDELNIITSLYGSSHDVPQIITKIGAAENLEMIEDLPLGSVISPGRFCCNTIVRYVRSMRTRDGAATSVYAFADGQVEAIEFLVDPDTFYCGKPLKQIKLKKNVRLACISRGNDIVIPNGDSSYAEGDSVIVLVSGDAVILNMNDIFA